MPIARNVAATPISATSTPPTRIPSGIDAHAPARTAPKTRPRSSTGTSSATIVKISGLTGPDASPTTAHAATATGSDGVVAITR